MCFKRNQWRHRYQQSCNLTQFMNCSLAAVSYEKHSSPSYDHSDINHRCDLWNWDIVGYIGMIFVVCLGLLFLGSPSLGEEIKVPSWKMGMKEFSKCVKPGQFKSVSSVIAKRCESGGSISQFAGTSLQFLFRH